MDDCLYVSVPTRANAVSRWIGKTEAEKKLDSATQQLTDVFLDRPSYYTFSHFPEGNRSMQAAALSSVREVFDRNGGMK